MPVTEVEGVERHPAVAETAQASRASHDILRTRRMSNAPGPSARSPDARLANAEVDGRAAKAPANRFRIQKRTLMRGW